jgi:hypothetical protein
MFFNLFNFCSHLMPLHNEWKRGKMRPQTSQAVNEEQQCPGVALWDIEHLIRSRNGMSICSQNLGKSEFLSTWECSLSVK